MMRASHPCARFSAALPLVLLFVVAILEAPAFGQAESGAKVQAESALSIAALTVTPENPGRETLCKLRARIANGGDQPAYALVFAVSLSGVDLPVYDDVVYIQAIPAQGSAEVELYNFWTGETGRPAPRDGKLVVEVKLLEAQFLKVGPIEESPEESPEKTTEKTESAGKEASAATEEEGQTWSSAGPVPGLPIRASVTLTLSGG